ncbi:DUF1330 domain-containing protein [Methylobacterium nonmethylotrophicum]|nr:DUF1330 domain-containing protein [Methylobacterium nonmethylotrophicum]
MTRHVRVAALLSGGLVGLASTAGTAPPLAADGKPPAYAIVELDVRQPQEFAREFFPRAAEVFAKAGGTFLARPGAPTAVDGAPPGRVAVIRFETREIAVATFASDAYREARKIGDRYADFRIFIVEGQAP